MGIAPAAKLVFAPRGVPAADYRIFPKERELESFIMVANHLEDNPGTWGAASLYYSISHQVLSQYTKYCMGKFDLS